MCALEGIVLLTQVILNRTNSSHLWALQRCVVVVQYWLGFAGERIGRHTTTNSHTYQQGHYSVGRVVCMSDGVHCSPS